MGWISNIILKPLTPKLLDWAELLEACHSMSKPSSPQENSFKKYLRGLLRIIVRLKCLVNAIGQHK